MGNHLVGEMFAQGTNVYSFDEISEMSQEQALAIIDRIGKRVVESTSLDAEFGDYLNPYMKFGQVLVKAFLPDKFKLWANKSINDLEAIGDYDIWDCNIYNPFKERFGFW